MMKHLLTRVGTLITAVLVALTPLAGVPIATAATATITVNGAQQFQTMDGFGVNINPNSWDNGNLKPALDLLVDQNGSKLFRVAIDMEDWEATNDNSDPNTFNWSYYDPIYSGAVSFDTNLAGSNFGNLWNTIDYLHTKGIPDSQIVLSNMGPGPAWMGGKTLNPAQEDEYVEMLVSEAYWGYTHGHTFGLFSPNNEMDISNNEGVTMSDTLNADVMNKVATRLNALGMTGFRLIGPDSCCTSGGYAQTMMGYPTLMAKLDHFDFHDYNGSVSTIPSDIAGSGKNFWMSEFNVFDQVFSLVNGGASAALVWEGYDSVYNHGILNGLGSDPGNDSFGNSAIIAYNKTTKAYTPRAPFYQFEQLFKFVPIGSKRISASSNNAGIHTLSFYDTASSRFTLVGNNTTASSQTITVSLGSLPTTPTTLSSYQTVFNDIMRQGADVAVSGGVATITVPAGNVFTLTGLGVADSVAPTAPTNLTATGAAGAANLSWTASTDNVGVSQYNVHRSATPGFTPSPANKVGQSTTTTFTNSGLAAGTYYYQVTAQDPAGNTSPASNEASATVTGDTTAPTVSVTAPAGGATVSGSTTVTASASDNVGVAGVQFKLDGANLGSEVTASPYTIAWDTATASNAAHTLTAVARDAAGNTTTSSTVSVTVNNVGGTLLVGTQTIQTGLDSNSSGEAEGFKFVASSTGTAGTFKFYVDSGSAATSLKVGVYTNNGVHPGTLLTSGSTTPVSGGWNTISLSPGANLVSGTTYWLAFLGNGGLLKYRDAAGTNCAEDANGSLTALPTTWTSGAAWSACNVSAYVTSASAPDTTAPTTAITAPTAGATVSGTAPVTATASDNVGVTKVELYTDGALSGTDTSSPYNFSLNTTSLSNGTHQLTTKAYDAAGNVGTSAAVSVTVSNDSAAPTVPAGVSATSTGMTSTHVSWTAATDNVAVTGYHVWRGGVQIATVTGTSYDNTGLTSGTTYSYTVSAFDAAGNESAQSAAAVVTTDTDTVAPTAPTNLSQTSATATTATLSWTAATDNVGVTGYHYYDAGILPLGTTTNTSVTYTGLSCGQTYNVGVDAYDAAGNLSPEATSTLTTVACDTTAPTVSLTAPAAGTVSGSVAVSATASDNVGVVGVQFLLDGANLTTEDTTSPYSVTWNTTSATNGTHTLSAVARDAAGNTTTSTPVTVTVNNTAAPITVDKQVSTHQTAAATSITSPTFTTTAGNELLVAFIGSDGPTGAQSISTVTNATGGTLTWTLRKRANSQAGTSEIWTAVAPSVLTGASVKATRSSGSYIGSITVMTFKNANLTTIGAVGGASAASGAATASLTATQTGSVVYGVGNDWDSATSRTLGSGQTLVDQYLATSFGDAFWVQTKTGTSTAGQVVTISDTAPTADRWNLATIEILPAP
jgi:chitodextrinase